MSRLEELTHKRFHGTVVLNPARVGHDASKVAEEVISHRHGIVGSQVRVTLEIEAEVPDGVPEQVVRIVAENSRALRLRARGLRWNRKQHTSGGQPGSDPGAQVGAVLVQLGRLTSRCPRAILE